MEINRMRVLGRHLSTHSRFHSHVNSALRKTTGFLNGQFLSSSDEKSVFPVYNPSNQELLAEVQNMNVGHALEAAEHAERAWKSFRLTTGLERSKLLATVISLLHTYKEDLATIIALETGKPLAEARGEVIYASDFFEVYASQARLIPGEMLCSPLKGRKMWVTRHAIGPAALITPWNFPLAMIARKAAPAIAAGCSMIIKPSEETPLSALAMMALFDMAKLPKGVVNCITTDRDNAPAVAEALTSSSLIRKVSFTGSTAVGRLLMKQSADTVKKLSLELGGNAPFLVFNDADVDLAVKVLFTSKFRNAGQACIAPNRVLVQSKIYNQFVLALKGKMESLKCGDGFDPTVNIGPLINRRGLLKVTSHVKDALSKGAECVVGGKTEDHLNTNNAEGLFHQPTVLVNITKDMLVNKEETFGPVISIMKFNTEEEGIDLANDTEFGLAAYACTRDVSRIFRLNDLLEAGMIGINEGGISAAVAPFGGVKQSGLGREGGPYGLEEFMEMKYICLGLDRPVVS